MKTTRIALSLLAGFAAGCATVEHTRPIATSDLPNCYGPNYDAQRGLFTIGSTTGNPVNQQCLLIVSPRGDSAPASRLRAGRYTVYLANGGGGGAGGTMQSFPGVGGGGGGGGAGAAEKQSIVDLTEGVYKLTIGAGGPGGSACVPQAYSLGGGPGWAGSPSNIIEVATGRVIMGPPGADTHVRPSRAQNDRNAGARDGHGGSGPGMASGGDGGHDASIGRAAADAEPGDAKFASGRTGAAGAAGPDASGDKRVGDGGGGGGGATSRGDGGGGGGETMRRKDVPPVRGSLGSGGGGGEGNMHACDAGAQGGHGFIAFRPI